MRPARVAGEGFGVTIQPVGFAELQMAYTRLPYELKEEAKMALTRAASAIVQKARHTRRFRDHTTRLRSSIRMEPAKTVKDGVQIVIKMGGPGIPYAQWVEEGTQPYVIPKGGFQARTITERLIERIIRYESGPKKGQIFSREVEKVVQHGLGKARIIFRTPDGRWIRKFQVNHPGIRARWFFRDAWMSQATRFRILLVEAMSQVMQRRRIRV